MKRIVRKNGMPVGFIRKTKGGFWRAYNYGAGGYGPLPTAAAAAAFVLEFSPVGKAAVSDIRRAIKEEI